jgi:hypothetical protein
MVSISWQNGKTQDSQRIKKFQKIQTKMLTIFCVIVPCNLIDVYYHFAGIYCLHHQGDETLVNFYQATQHYNPADCHLHTHRCDYLKSYTTWLKKMRITIKQTSGKTTLE